MATNITFHPGLRLSGPDQWTIAHNLARICRYQGEGGPPATEGNHNLVDWAQRQRQGRTGVGFGYRAGSLSRTQSTIACALEQHLLHLHQFTYRLDGDNVRFGLNKDLGFDEKSRNENIRRIGEVRPSESNPFPPSPFAALP